MISAGGTIDFKQRRTILLVTQPDSPGQSVITTTAEKEKNISPTAVTTDCLGLPLQAARLKVSSLKDVAEETAAADVQQTAATECCRTRAGPFV